jgi:hypothetical protein
MIQEVTMNCNKCHSERARGKVYYFYHGAKTTNYSRDQVLNTVRTTTWSLKGEGSAWICDHCVNLRFAFQVTFLLAVLGVAVYFLATNNTFTTLTSTINLAFSLIALGLALIIAPPRSRRETAEFLAIGLNKKALKQQGSRAFLTNTKYQNLKKKKRW